MWPTDDRTQELLQKAREGQNDAVEALLDRHRLAVHRLVQLRLDRRLRQRVDVSDIVQETLMEANRRLREYLEAPKMDFHLWLRQIARDRMIDAHRRHRGTSKRAMDREQSIRPRNSYRSASDPAGQLPDLELTPAAAALNREMVQLVEAALANMDDPDSEIILMRHYENLSNQEVAQVLGLSEPAASMRYLRAIRKLRDALGLNDSNNQP
jgi:RNA polymerase sigma-70 factor (ECF subfamily)